MPDPDSTPGDSRARPRVRWRCAAGIAAVVVGAALTFGAAAWAGWNGRVFAPTRHVMVRGDRRAALDAWRDVGVHGRILVHFDRRLAMSDEPGETTDDNVLHRAAAENLVREVFHVVPDDAWPRVRARLEGAPAVARTGETYRLTVEDVPVVVSRMQDLAALEEPVLVTIDVSAWSDPEAGRLVDRLHARGLESDVTVVYGPGAPGLAQRIRERP